MTADNKRNNHRLDPITVHWGGSQAAVAMDLFHLTKDPLTLLAGDDFWDGRSWNRRGRNTYLYVTAHGHYFLHFRTLWPAEEDGLTEMISRDEARCIYENLQNKRKSRGFAFESRKGAGLSLVKKLPE